MTVGGETDVTLSALVRTNSPQVIMMALTVSTVRLVKIFTAKAVESGVVVFALNRTASVEASHVTTAPSGSGKVAASTLVTRKLVKSSLLSQNSSTERSPGGEVTTSTETVAQ